MARKPAEQSVSRDEIIFAAAEVLRKRGYELTTMKDIAAQVNLTAASLYHHFTNKDTLLLAVLDSGIHHVIMLIEPVVQDKLSNAEKLRQMIRIHINELTQNTAVGAAMVFEVRPLLAISQYSTSKVQKELLELRNQFFMHRDYFEQLFRQVIADGIEANEFKVVDVPIFVKAMLGAQNWVGVWYRDGGRLNGIQIADEMADTFLASLGVAV